MAVIAASNFRGRLAGQKGNHMPTEESGGSPGRRRRTGSPFSERGHSWLTAHARYPIVWAATGLLALGGLGAFLFTQEPSARPRAQTAYCGLVSCEALRSVMASASARSPGPSPSAALVKPAVTRVPAPAAPLAATPAPGSVAGPVPTPMPAPVPTPTSTGTRQPRPVPTWAPPSPRWPWPLRWPWPWREGRLRTFGARHFGGAPLGGR